MPGTQTASCYYELMKLFTLLLGRNPGARSGKGAQAFTPTTGYAVKIDGRDVVVPYRVKFSGSYAPSDTAEHYCRRSRSSDGYKREAALRKLISYKKLTRQEAAYVLVALGDYVIEISTIPLEASAETKEELRALVRENGRLVYYLDALTTSYWNEYYRRQYPNRNDYPPYAFLQSLKRR